MAEFEPTSEAVEAVAKALHHPPREQGTDIATWQSWRPAARAAIAAFVEAEGLKEELILKGKKFGEDPEVDVRLVGPWRKHD